MPVAWIGKVLVFLCLSFLSCKVHTNASHQTSQLHVHDLILFGEESRTFEEWLAAMTPLLCKGKHPQKPTRKILRFGAPVLSPPVSAYWSD